MLSLPRDTTSFRELHSRLSIQCFGFASWDCRIVELLRVLPMRTALYRRLICRTITWHLGSNMQNKKTNICHFIPQTNSLFIFQNTILTAKGCEILFNG